MSAPAAAVKFLEKPLGHALGRLGLKEVISVTAATSLAVEFLPKMVSGLFGFVFGRRKKKEIPPAQGKQILSEVRQLRAEVAEMKAGQAPGGPHKTSGPKRHGKPHPVRSSGSMRI